MASFPIKQKITDGTVGEVIVVIGLLAFLVFCLPEPGWVLALAIFPVYLLFHKKMRLPGSVILVISISIINLHFLGFKVYGYRNVFSYESPLKHPVAVVRIVYPNQLILATGVNVELTDYKLTDAAMDMPSDELIRSLGFILEDDGTLLLDIEGSDAKHIYGKYRLGYFEANLRHARFFPGKRPAFVRLPLVNLLKGNRYFIDSSDIAPEPQLNKGRWLPSIIAPD